MKKYQLEIRENVEQAYGYFWFLNSVFLFSSFFPTVPLFMIISPLNFHFISSPWTLCFLFLFLILFWLSYLPLYSYGHSPFIKLVLAHNFRDILKQNKTLSLPNSAKQLLIDKIPSHTERQAAVEDSPYKWPLPAFKGIIGYA